MKWRPDIFKRLKKLRLSGSTLVEVLVSLSLISIVFVIGTMTWLQLNSHQSPYRMLEYRMQARNILENAAQGDIQNEVIHLGGVNFVKQSELLNPDQQLYEVKIQCISGTEQLVFERSRIVKLYAD